ncbi:hypothetical protein LP7551_03322 [Roseibium album]|nr:hypothetical protein LP7551_03322 [Roseibium album]
MRRPAPETIEAIQHPGPMAEERRPYASCLAKAVSFDLQMNQPLLEALGRWAESAGYCSAVLDLGGVSLSPFDYVMPDCAIDDRHAAWYSDTRSSSGAVLDEAVAILGWRDGNWFAHIHAYWEEAGSNHLGHLLPDTLSVNKASRISGFGLRGARFKAELDPETEFTLFRVKADPESMGKMPPNALITTLAPFEDLHDSVLALSSKLPESSFSVFGLGSLAGAEFFNAPPMTGMISEILLQGALLAVDEKELQIPVRTVDLHGTLHKGTLVPGRAPTLVTCELLLMVKDE